MQRATNNKNTSKSTADVTPPPLYYKIELVQGLAVDGNGLGSGEDNINHKKKKNNSMVQLMVGDDSYVQLTSDHNEQLQLVNSNTANSHIIRVSAIIEH